LPIGKGNSNIFTFHKLQNKLGVKTVDVFAEKMAKNLNIIIGPDTYIQTLSKNIKIRPVKQQNATYQFSL
jgi:hypothetical protein